MAWIKDILVDRGQGSLNADVSENTLPFVSQSINNFSDYDWTGSVPLCPLMFSWALSHMILLSVFF